MASDALDAPVGPAKTKAKRVPRYVKEALKEVEQEQAARTAQAKLAANTKIPPVVQASGAPDQPLGGRKSKSDKHSRKRNIKH